LPLEWKTGVVTAIYKKGPKTEMGNYRPVSLTSIVCKVVQSLVRDKIMNHLKRMKLTQYGFIKGRSTSLQLLHMLDKWTEFLEGGGQIDTIYTDFEKAFDKVPHKRLIKKLYAFGIDQKLINWTKEFLTDRQHMVRVNGKLSQWLPVISGIPQGTILGPLLFIIYINDLPSLCEDETGIYLFADDAKLYKFIKLGTDHQMLQNNVDRLQAWSNEWLLKLNIKKCKIISFGTDKNSIIKHEYSITVNQIPTPLGREQYMTDLGIVLDENLKFSRHIHNKVNKAYSMLGVIKRNFKHLSKDTFVLLYKSMVRSHIEYGSSVWSPYRKMDIEELEKVQKRATKMIHGFDKLNYNER
jgi:hypothetical protein